jgi:hypothetical protein
MFAAETVDPRVMWDAAARRGVPATHANAQLVSGERGSIAGVTWILTPIYRNCIARTRFSSQACELRNTAGRRMPGSRASVFGEAEEFQAALRVDGFAGVLFTGRGQFQARLTQVVLKRWRLAAAEEEQSRIAFIAVPAGIVTVAFPIDGGPSPICGGVETRSGRNRRLRAGRAAARKNRRGLSLGCHSGPETAAR